MPETVQSVVNLRIGRCAHCRQAHQLPGRCRHGRLCRACQMALDALTAEAGSPTNGPTVAPPGRPRSNP